MGPRDRFYPYLYHCHYIGMLGTGFMQVFLKLRRVTRYPLVFRGLTGSQRTPGFGASQFLLQQCLLYFQNFYRGP